MTADRRPAEAPSPDAHVTVVIPTKDRPASLARTLASVQAQRNVAVQVVVVDDGSSPPHWLEVQAAASSALVLRNPVSRGVSAARNSGLAQARTPWVAFVDDDDLWAPDKLARQLAAAEASPDDAGWVCSAAAHFADDLGVLHVHEVPPPGDLLLAMLGGNVVPGGGSGVLARTDLMRQVGGFDTALSTLADRDCWIRLAAAAPVAVVNLPDVGYRISSTSMAHDTRRAQDELRRLRSKHDALYAAHGVELDDRRWTDYLQSQAYRSGDWRTGARLSVRLLWRHGEPRGAVQPVLAFAPPTVRRALRGRRLRRLDRVLLGHARAWLADELELHQSAGRQAAAADLPR